jgi:primosomal protein N' (replication factor Y)
VIAADLGLHMPDFRAAERTFQLLTQVAGRAERAGAPGRVLLQTFVPDHYAIAPVATHDYERFYREEIGHRATLGYPPFGALAHVLLTGEDDQATRRAGEALVADVGAVSGVDVIGPVAAPLARLRGRFRYYVVAKGASEAAVREACKRLGAGLARLPREITGSLDAAPVSML